MHACVPSTECGVRTADCGVYFWSLCQPPCMRIVCVCVCLLWSDVYWNMSWGLRALSGLSSLKEEDATHPLWGIVKGSILWAEALLGQSQCFFLFAVQLQMCTSGGFKEASAHADTLRAHWEIHTSWCACVQTAVWLGLWAKSAQNCVTKKIQTCKSTLLPHYYSQIGYLSTFDPMINHNKHSCKLCVH